MWFHFTIQWYVVLCSHTGDLCVYDHSASKYSQYSTVQYSHVGSPTWRTFLRTFREVLQGLEHGSLVLPPATVPIASAGSSFTHLHLQLQARLSKTPCWSRRKKSTSTNVRCCPWPFCPDLTPFTLLLPWVPEHLEYNSCDDHWNLTQWDFKIMTLLLLLH